MKNILVIDLARCTGCRNCELACSVRNYRVFNPARSRIQIIKDEPNNIILPVVCLQCEDPLCREACPTGAIITNSAGVLTVNHEVCIGCYNCVTACVYGGVTIDPVTRKTIKCDLCGGDPACVKACEYHAISVQSVGSKSALQRYQGMREASIQYGLEQEAE